MPLTPIACPSCGNILQANSLEKEGVVGTPCRECGETVFIQTDEDGRVEAIFAGHEGPAQAAYADAYADDDESVHHGKLGGSGKRNFVPLIMAGLGLLLVVWVANSVFCTRAKVPLPPAEPEEIVIKTSPTPAATPFVLNRENGVVFESGKALLLPESRNRLEELAKRLLAVSGDRVFEIAGYTDNTGDEAANVKLSQARAEAVRVFLRKQGVSAEMLTVKGYGSLRPVSDNTTPEGRERNRRIEIVPLPRATRDLAGPE